jgi:hypothetical protein
MIFKVALKVILGARLTNGIDVVRRQLNTRSLKPS